MRCYCLLLENAFIWHTQIKQFKQCIMYNIATLTPHFLWTISFTQLIPEESQVTCPNVSTCNFTPVASVTFGVALRKWNLTALTHLCGIVIINSLKQGTCQAIISTQMDVLSSSFCNSHHLSTLVVDYKLPWIIALYHWRWTISALLKWYNPSSGISNVRPNSTKMIILFHLIALMFPVPLAYGRIWFDPKYKLFSIW